MTLRPEIKVFFVFLLLAIFLPNCKNSPENADPKEIAPTVSIEQNSLSVKYNNNEYSIPSPHQASLLVKKNGIEFKPEFLHSPEQAIQYVTNVKQALNLGIYGTDLGYINIYDQSNEAFSYYGVIKDLTKELNLLDALQAESISKIEQNVNNSDSLLIYLSRIYMDIDKYLKKNDQRNIGALIIAGGWIESMYIVSQYYLQDNNPILFAYIGEQKYPLDNLIEILSPYYNQSDEYSVLIDDFVKLSYIFDAVEFTYTHPDPASQSSENGIKIMTKTEMEVFDEVLTKIANQITEIRNNIVE